jgi:hypothetical protein
VLDGFGELHRLATYYAHFWLDESIGLSAIIGIIRSRPVSRIPIRRAEGGPFPSPSLGVDFQVKWQREATLDSAG